MGILLKDLEMMKNLFNLNPELTVSCSEISSVITTSFESNLELSWFPPQKPKWICYLFQNKFQ